jgi:hypothetical protein
LLGSPVRTYVLHQQAFPQMNTSLSQTKEKNIKYISAFTLLLIRLGQPLAHVAGITP